MVRKGLTKKRILRLNIILINGKKGEKSGKSMNKTVAAEESRAYLRDGNSRPR